jgi:ArsR family transcriptional regulator
MSCISTSVNIWGELMTKTKATTSTPVADDGLCCSSVVDAPLNETEATELARVLGALADPVRLRLLSLVASQIEICSCDLEAPLGKSQPTISHHTKVLADAGLLVGEKRGRWMWWRVEPTRLASVRTALGG